MKSQQRLAKFVEKLNQEEYDWEENFAFWIYVIEKQTGAFIDKDYPILKLFSQIENFKRYAELEKSEYKRHEAMSKAKMR